MCYAPKKSTAVFNEEGKFTASTTQANMSGIYKFSSKKSEIAI